MKYTIDEKTALKHHLSLDEMLALMLAKQKVNFSVLLERMLKRELVHQDMFGNYVINDYWDDEMQQVLLESDKDVPKEANLNRLVEQLREIFPKGIKTGSAAWRGNTREIKLRLQKFFKIYENTYSDEAIIEATKKYVDSFNGNYTYMRILKYFILKDEIKIDEYGNRYVEQVSELANFLENEMENDNFEFCEMR